MSYHARAYRTFLKELISTSAASGKLNRSIASSVRPLFEKYRGCDDKEKAKLDVHFENAQTFIRAQQEFKVLVDRYNPLVDLTEEERIEATARRVGLNMPITPDKSKARTAVKLYELKGEWLQMQLASRLPSQIFWDGMALATKILKCDPYSIYFPRNATKPQISCSETMDALLAASRELKDAQKPVAFPTETVYGLGALALNPSAASKIFAVKGRPPDNPLIVHVSSIEMLHSLLPRSYTVPKTYEVLISRFWPGPLTLLFPNNQSLVPSIITANQPSVAIRMPSHPVARALISIADAPLAAPSANSSGRPSPTRAEHVFNDIQGKINIILDGGACDVGLESTVVDGLQPDGKIRVLRPGGVTVEDMEKAFSEESGTGSRDPEILVHRRDYEDSALEQSPTTPGMKYRHYSPSVPVELLMTVREPANGTQRLSTASYIDQLVNRFSPLDGPLRLGILSPLDGTLAEISFPEDRVQCIRYALGKRTEPAKVAKLLFDGLLTLDKAAVNLILIEEISETDEGLAVMNRIRKAAGSCVWLQI